MSDKGKWVDWRMTGKCALAGAVMAIIYHLLRQW